MEKGSRELSRVTPRSIEISPSEEFKRVLPIIVSLVTEVDDGIWLCSTVVSSLFRYFIKLLKHHSIE